MADAIGRLQELARELKRRGVVRVFVVYVAAGFVVLQAVQLLVPLLLLPDWVSRLVLVLLLAGLPVALVLGWAYDLTPEGVQPAGPQARSVEAVAGPDGDAAAGGARAVAAGDARPSPIPRSTVLLAAGLVALGLGLWWVAPRIDLPMRTRSGPDAARPAGADPGTSRPARLEVAPPPGTRLTGSPFDVAISPDGEVIVFAATDGDSTRLYQRHIDEFEARAIPGASGTRLFFSADGRRIGYVRDDRLWKVSLVGGEPRPLAEIVTWFGGATWGANDTIVYADGQLGIFRVSAARGEPERLWSVGRGGGNVRNPRWLVEGKSLLVTQGLPGRGMRVTVLDVESGQTQVLLEQGHNARYLPDEKLLLYHVAGDLLASRLEVEDPLTPGRPVPVVSGTPRHPLLHAGNVAISKEGTLVYLADPGVRVRGRLVWADTAGRMEPLRLPTGRITRYKGLRVSPEGGRIAFTQQIRTAENVDVWIYETESGHLRQVTSDQGDNWWPIWAPDGERILHNSNRASEEEPGSGLYLYETPLGTPGEVRLLARTPASIQAQAWTPTGDTLAFQDNTIDDALEGEETLRDIWLLSLVSEEPERWPLLRTRFDEMHPAFSPDGRWLAYVSDESGEREVYVTGFPEMEPARRVSSRGGVGPIWAPEGDALYFRSLDGDTVYRAPVSTGGADSGRELAPGEPRPLFHGRYYSERPWGRMYDLHPDGDRFLMLQIVTEGTAEGEASALRVVLGWLAEVRARLAAGGG